MSDPAGKNTSRRETGETQIIGFRLPKAVAKAIKMEAAGREIPLNALLAEMWTHYRESKRGG
jgi:hypothetical protein